MHRQRLSERRCKGQRRYRAKRWGNEVVTHRSTHPAQGFGFAGSGPCSFGAFTSRSLQPPDGAVTSDAPGSRRSSPRRDLTSWVQTVLQEGFLSGRAATPGLETPCSTHREIPKPSHGSLPPRASPCAALTLILSMPASMRSCSTSLRAWAMLLVVDIVCHRL